MENNFVKQVKEITDELNPQMVEFCGEMIKTPSLAGEEGDMGDLVFSKLTALGYDEVFRDDWGNVCGIVHGEKPGPTIMYNGHMDVVTEGDLAEWDGYDPYGAEIDVAKIFDKYNEKEEEVEVIHGRGASDMKCGLGAQIFTGAALIKLREMGIKWKGDFLLTAVVLEENGEMMGTIKLCENELPKRNIQVDGMVCAEPSSLKLALGHRGRMEIKVTVHGQSCHGSSPWLGINAVEKAAKLIVAVNEKFSKEVAEDENLGRAGIALTIIDCEPAALCIVPDKCSITYDRRLVPGETVEGAIQEIRDIADEIAKTDPDFKADVSINSSVRSSYTGKSESIESKKDVWIIDREHPFIEACSEALTDSGEEVRYQYWPFSTDVPQIGSIMKKPAVGFSAGQELYIHNGIEKVRLDYLAKSLEANTNMYLRISELPMDSFTVE